MRDMLKVVAGLVAGVLWSTAWHYSPWMPLVSLGLIWLAALIGLIAGGCVRGAGEADRKAESSGT